MGSDAKRLMAAAEKLLKQGKADEAVAQFERVVEESGGDLLTVNRVGDALVAAGQPGKAVPYYGRIADQFARQGYFPKAIAIRKKILRLMPEAVEPLVALGDLYVRQEHPGEARTHYLRAADRLLQEKDFDGAREVYERLVQAEPDDPRHRVRLAETRAAGGDQAGAAEDLIALGQRLLQSGKPEDAEKSFSRAGELDPTRHEVVKGRIDCLTETGRDDEALVLLETEAAKPGAAAELTAELLVLYEINGRTQQADELLAGGRAADLATETFRTIVQFHDRKGGTESLWARYEPRLKQWDGDGRTERVVELLEGFDRWTKQPFAPPLQWRLERLGSDGGRAERIELLEKLLTAYTAADNSEAAQRVKAQLADLRPEAPVAEQCAEAPARAAGAEAAPAAEASPAPAVEVPVEYEAPAVPLSRADEEFVAGRMTQAEILEKYGLLNQAVDQLYEVVERFPGHLEANQRLVTLQRGSAQDSTLARSLVKLGLARRAAGRIDVAKQSVSEAVKLGGIDEPMRRILQALDLLPGGGGAEVPAASVSETAPARAAAEPPPPVAAAEPGVPTPASAETVIDFDSFDDEDDEDAAVAADAPAAGDERPAAVAEPPAPPSTRSTEDAMRFEPLPALDEDQDDADLAALAAALDDDLLADEALDDAPTSESEESLDEVFAAFRERVEAEVGAQDYRTHYDLGIGYKEMGLIDAAIAEFEISVKGEELFQESCVMLALCYKDKAHLDRAADWYRQAVDALEDDPGTSLRYDLAETLLEAGDTEGAVLLFRALAEANPGFRDVATRLAQLSPAGSD